ncbi:Os01g0770150 [Oryza sativa Japonica Group]|uniref:Os01g0770150 protein n=1 Tax=Oryza sativa subsp. japonica TaxID=39947 RepID=A0A0P0V8N8_ORYSJ|nr:Os01g0770150 [Oryza sativa Japonica Group]
MQTCADQRFWKNLSVAASGTGRQARRAQDRVRRWTSPSSPHHALGAGRGSDSMATFTSSRGSTKTRRRQASSPQTLLFVVLHLASQIAKGVLGFRGEEYTRRHNPAA